MTQDSTSTMRMIQAVEDAMEAAKGKKATMFLTALHEKGFRVEVAREIEVAKLAAE